MTQRGSVPKYGILSSPYFPLFGLDMPGPIQNPAEHLR